MALSTLGDGGKIYGVRKFQLTSRKVGSRGLSFELKAASIASEVC